MHSANEPEKVNQRDPAAELSAADTRMLSSELQALRRPGPSCSRAPLRSTATGCCFWPVRPRLLATVATVRGSDFSAGTGPSRRWL